jgi:RNA polymerase-binding transcription factor DksA
MSAIREILEAEWRQHVSTVVQLSIDICDVQAVDSPGASGPAAGLPPDDALRVTARMIAAERFIVREIEAALVRLEQGTYGRCEQCGGMVTAERLEILPYTRYCARCQPRATRAHDPAVSSDAVSSDAEKARAGYFEAENEGVVFSDADRVGAP